jgi:5-carboxymethyl-2-hydroxymuconate isomerase
MPHLTLEYTDNLLSFNAGHALNELNHVLIESGKFKEIDIKSRAIRLDTFVVGTTAERRGFVHVKLAMMGGRSNQTKVELSDSLLLALKAVCEPPANTHVQLCVEILDIDRESYAKASIGS